MREVPTYVVTDEPKPCSGGNSLLATGSKLDFQRPQLINKSTILLHICNQVVASKHEHSMKEFDRGTTMLHWPNDKEHSKASPEVTELPT